MAHAFPLPAGSVPQLAKLWCGKKHRRKFTVFGVGLNYNPRFYPKLYH
jgi:hypothetical protein